MFTQLPPPSWGFLSGTISTMSSLPPNWPNLFIFLVKDRFKGISSAAQPFSDNH